MEKGRLVTTGGFDGEGWVTGLTTAITELAKIQHGYWTEWDAQRQAHKRDRTGWSPWGHKVYELSSFYGHTSSEGAYFERSYGPLRNNLEQAKRALTGHPALERAEEPSTGNDGLQIGILSRGSRGNMTTIVAGLVARGSEPTGRPRRSCRPFSTPTMIDRRRGLWRICRSDVTWPFSTGCDSERKFR